MIINRLCAWGIFKPLMTWGLATFTTVILVSLLIVVFIVGDPMNGRHEKAIVRGAVTILLFNAFVVFMIGKLIHSVMEYYELRRCGGPFARNDLVEIKYGAYKNMKAVIINDVEGDVARVEISSDLVCFVNVFDLFLVKRYG